MKKLITAVLLLSTFFFSCNQAVKGEYATVVVDLGGSASGARAIDQNELPFLKDTHITIEAVGRLSGTFVKEFAPGEAGNIALRLITGDTVRLRVKASNASGIWSGSTTFTVEEGTNAVSVKLNKTISGAQAITFSMTKTGTTPFGDQLYHVDLYAGNKKVGSKDNVLSPPSFCRDAKGRIFVAYYYDESSRKKVDLIRYDSEGNESEKLIEKDQISSPLILASDLTTKEVYAVRSGELYKVGTGSFKLWPSVDMSHLPYNFSGINLIAAHNGQLFVFGQKNGENNSHLYVYDINLSETSFTLAHEKLNTKLSVPPTDTSYTDMFVTDGAVYLLRRDYSAVPDSHGKVYSKGALIKYEYNKAKKKIDDHEEFGKSDEDDENGIVLTPDTSFYGPTKFIGFDDDVLYIADDGVKFTYFNEVPRITANKNRIASFNTSTNSLSFTDTSATWAKEEKVWKAPSTHTVLWDAEWEDSPPSFKKMIFKTLEGLLSNLFQTSDSSNENLGVFTFDQDGNLYIPYKHGSDVKIKRFIRQQDGSYNADTDEMLLPGTDIPTVIAVDISRSVKKVDSDGTKYYNALYYTDGSIVNRKLWGNNFSTSPSAPVYTITPPAGSATQRITALAANKDGVFVAVHKRFNPSPTVYDYGIALLRYRCDDSSGPQNTLAVVPDHTPETKGGFTITEILTDLYVQDGVLYGLTAKRMEENAPGGRIFSSGALWRIGNTDGSNWNAVKLYSGKDDSTVSETNFTPCRFIAVKPKKLVIASDGYCGYRDENSYLDSKNFNKIVTFDIGSWADPVQSEAPSGIGFTTTLLTSAGMYVWH